MIYFVAVFNRKNYDAFCSGF